MQSIAERAVIDFDTPTLHLSTAVLDINLQFMRWVPWTKAMTMIVRESANTIQPYYRDMPDGVREPVFVKTPNHEIQLPFIVSLRKFVYDPYAGFLRSNSPIATKRAILTRDGFQCAYCGEKGDTVDHIIPQSRGGGNQWTNLVTACFDCNQEKADRTPEEAGMTLLFSPESYDGGREDTQTEIHQYLMAESGVFV